MTTLVIAEAGVNHNGDLDMACRMIDVASSAGADAVKFQTFSASRLATRDAPKASYQATKDDPRPNQFEMLKDLELSLEAHVQLIEHCHDAGIQFLSTGFDEKSVDLLWSLGLRQFKIPSGEVTNLPYLRHLGEYGLPIIMSTGLATMAEVEAALEILERSGTPREIVTVLHCTTQYPTPAHDVNLRAMVSMRETLGVSVGYSDHTLGIEAPIAAVALGAEVVEKHFTLDRTLRGPDHKASLEPSELAQMVAAVRRVEEMLGDGVKSPRPSEVPNLAVVRRSIVATEPIHAGERFTQTNIAAKRPGTGLSPMLWDTVIGAVANRNYRADELIEL